VRSLADDSLIADFVTECREHLDAIEPDLMIMEHLGAATDQEVINKVFRAIHSIKGGAGFFAFETLKTLSHIMESVLMQVRDRSLVVSAAVMDPLFASLDRLRAMLDDIQASDGIPIAQELAGLKAILEGQGVPVRAGLKAPARELDGTRAFDPDPEAVRSVLRRGMTLYCVKARLHRDVDAQWDSPLAFLKNALSVGECLEAFLDLSAIGGLDDDDDQDLAVSLLFATVLEADLVPHALKLPPEQAVPMDMEALQRQLGALVPAMLPAGVAPELLPPAEEEAEAPRAGATPARGKEPAADTLRVRVGLLTTLMDLSGEMVLGRNQLLRMMGPHAVNFPGLAGILQNINQVTTRLQEAAMQTRMQPVGTLFGKFQRIIRDLSKQLDKQIELEVHGADVELDKSIVELLADPLTHIIRNAVDHAIETPAQRRQQGKPATGRIVLSAFHEGGLVNIVIEDDGRGIDADKIGRKAVAKGVITEAQRQGMGPRDLVNLVFAPGFSMAEQVSDLSGRGVGMDVVRTNTEQLGGVVDLDTRLGHGTTVRLRLPLTLAIMPAMIVAAGGQRFALPQVDVIELVWVRAEDVKERIEHVQGAEVLRLRDRLLPLVRLSEVLQLQATFQDPASRENKAERRTRIADRRGLPEAPEAEGAAKARRSDRRKAWRSDYNVVVLQVGSNPYGIIVDELHDFEEIVVKPISSYLEGQACFSGTTILGDGRVIMILDSAGVAERAQLRFADLQSEQRRRQEAEAQRLAALASRQRSVVLFEVGPGERFAIAQEHILRLEQIRVDAISRIGEREYLTYRGESLSLLRLDQYFQTSPIRADLEELYLVIPYLEDAQGQTPPGILVSTILDATDVDVELRPVAIQGPGLLGSAVVQGGMTLFLDPVAFVRAVAGGCAS
jgi:two-component system chemotaxis sensor kinase CheA